MGIRRDSQGNKSKIKDAMKEEEKRKIAIEREIRGAAQNWKLWGRFNQHNIDVLTLYN